MFQPRIDPLFLINTNLTNHNGNGFVRPPHNVDEPINHPACSQQWQWWMKAIDSSQPGRNWTRWNKWRFIEKSYCQVLKMKHPWIINRLMGLRLKLRVTLMTTKTRTLLSYTVQFCTSLLFKISSQIRRHSPKRLTKCRDKRTPGEMADTQIVY